MGRGLERCVLFHCIVIVVFLIGGMGSLVSRSCVLCRCFLFHLFSSALFAAAWVGGCMYCGRRLLGGENNMEMFSEGGRKLMWFLV